MSTKIQKDIVCPACGQTQKLEMYTSVNAEENPELRRDILRESMFDWECLPLRLHRADGVPHDLP